jgi:carbon storage regulator
MLRITRRAGERIILGENVIVEVMEIRGQTVRLGIEAPRSVPIYREEIWLEVQRENQAAATIASAQLPGVLGVQTTADRPAGDPAPPAEGGAPSD